MGSSRNYLDDKKGWVTFKDKRPKVKLRAYIADLAKKLTKYNDKSQFENRDELIEYYNKDGIQGVNIYMQLKVDEILKKIT